MNIQYVTCSGVNEHTDVEDLAFLLRGYKRAEIGVQVNEKKCSYRSDRMAWIMNLAATLRIRNQVINAALHVNPSWVEDVGQGILPRELHSLMLMRNVKGDPLFQRIQLNFKIGRDRTPDMYKLFELIRTYASRRFIFSYNEANAEFISKFYKLCQEFGVAFDLLYDDSHGEGIEPKERKAPVFFNVRQGYAGGIGPENVADVLDSINSNLPLNFYGGITLDAEGRLKSDKNRISLSRCSSYLAEVHHWLAMHDA